MTGQVHLRGPGGGVAKKEDNDTLLQVELNDDRTGTLRGRGGGFAMKEDNDTLLQVELNDDRAGTLPEFSWISN